MEAWLDQPVPTDPGASPPAIPNAVLKDMRHHQLCVVRARRARGAPGVLHGSRADLLPGANGQGRPAHANSVWR